jgi:hypothetical protein
MRRKSLSRHPCPLNKITGLVRLAIDVLLVLMGGIGRNDGCCPAQRQLDPQLLRVIAHVADQTSVGRQFGWQLVACGDISDVARCEGKTKQPPLTVSDAMDLCRSATAGAADGLLACAALSAGGGALNLDRGAVDGSRVIGHGRHECAEDRLPAPAVAPTVETIVDRRAGAIDRRTILPAATAAQDMNNPANDPPIIVPACAGVDLGKQWLDRKRCSATLGVSALQDGWSDCQFHGISSSMRFPAYVLSSAALAALLMRKHLPV